jgi:hypothetical protein
MKLPFSINRYYTTHFSKSQVAEELSNLATVKKFRGLRTDKYVTDISDNRFRIDRQTYGVHGFTLGQFPVIEGIYFSERPLTMNILIKPSYFAILFFSLFVFTFIPAAIFVDKMTFNGVYKSPTISERFLFGAIGGLMPGLWCYFGYIRPVKMAEKWIVEKLSLHPG